MKKEGRKEGKRPRENLLGAPFEGVCLKQERILKKDGPNYEE